MIYRPLIEDMIWSYSRIKSFEDCPYRWFLRYICGYEDTPMFYSSYGSFMHKLIEQFYRGELTKDEMYIKFLFDFSKEVKGERPRDSTVKKYIQAGIDYLSQFEAFPCSMIDVEKKIEFEINGDPFVGFIDYIGEKDGEIYIIDNKSRDLKQRSGRKKPTAGDLELDEMLRQLYLYSTAIKNEYGKYPKWLCFNCFKAKRFIAEEFNEETYLGVVEWAQNSVEEIKNTNDFPPSIDFFGCKYICGVNDRCCYY